MTKFIQPALVVTALVAAVLSSTAGAAPRSHDTGSSSWTNTSDPYGGYGLNTPEGARAFWDYQARHGH